MSRANTASINLETGDWFMQSILIVSLTRIAQDVRVLRQIASLSSNFRILSVGYGVKPDGVERHISIPDNFQHLPLNLGALLPHVFRRYSRSSRSTKAIDYLSDRIRDLDYDLAVLNDVQSLPLLEFIVKPVVVDMHEYAPREMDDDWRFRFLLMRYYTWLCSKYLPKASKVCTVSKSLANEYSKQFKIPVTVVMNARSYVDLPVRPCKSESFRLVHSGLAAKSRQLNLMIDAVKELENLTLDLYLVSAPRQPGTLRALKRMASHTTNVRVLDPVPAEEIPRVLNSYDLSLVFLAPNSFSVKHCLPNKVFDSIQARVGILSSPLPDVVDFCVGNGVGTNTSETSAEALRMALQALSIDDVNSFKRSCEQVAKLINAEAEGLKLRELVLDALQQP